MKSPLPLRLAAWLCLCLATASQSPAQSPQSLFDGQVDSDGLPAGWSNPYDWGTVEIVDGEIQLTADKKFFLVTDQVYHDYEMTGEIRLPPGKSNSGFMARGQVEPNKVYGYQAEADPTPRQWSGGLYDESRRQWLNPLTGQPKAQAAFDKGDWNTYRIRCVGDHLQFFINDVATTDYFDPVDQSGRIGIQHHGENGQTYRFRNLQVTDLGKSTWEPLFDGESIDDWQAIGGGDWSVEDGMIRGRANAADSVPNGMLYHPDTFGDATFRIVYRVKKGNSGFFVRCEKLDEPPYVKGLQCEIEPQDDVAGLYQTGGGQWLAHPLDYLEDFDPGKAPGVRKRWKAARKDPTGWNTLVVSTHGKRAVTHLNDCLAADLMIDNLPAQGRIAVQLHGNDDLEIDFKSIEVLRTSFKSDN